MELVFLEDFSVIVCKQHCTAVVSLDAHLCKHHAASAALRRQILERFSQFKTVALSAIELLDEPAQPLDELGEPLDGAQCKTCSWITVNKDEMRRHCKKKHQQAWVGEKSLLYDIVIVQSFFCTGGLQKYFIVKAGAVENRQNSDLNQVVEEQLNAWRQVRNQLEEDIQVMGNAAKTDKTGWFKRTGWLEFLKGRNLVYLAHQARLPDRNEVKLQAAAQLTEQLIEKKPGDGFVVRGRQISINNCWRDCRTLRVRRHEERQMDKYLSQRDQAIHSSEELSGDGAGTESEYNDSNDDNNADSDGNDSVVLER
ncbi:hypothetical protein C7974DRAFT_473178 [Boeremia exigua]|uniref:uncharacterized protein n=1 Tax=Boeremia exigua TaxID=749465 RepID=UPI001E8E9DD4|nr:uncharacterized protein C7974DRAFT_473178 [Boeremia exigua]KAH6625935.1 hypothetical protein C7974DRAFT_473178 [Boeremia exigua]